MKKRVLAVILSMAMAFSCLTACGDSSSTADSSKTESSSKAETTTSVAEDSSSQSETTTTTTSETTTTTTTTQATTTEAPKSNRFVLDVKNIQAKPELPTGKEITAAAIVLNYYGIGVDKMELLNYLKTDKLPGTDGTSNPAEAFIGDPKLDTGYGCTYSVIVQAVRKYFRGANISNFTIKSLHKPSFSELYTEIDNGNPIIIWATIGLNDPSGEIKWTDYSGYPIIWYSNQHCLVLIGYDKDKDTVILSDPLDPKGTVEYPRAQVEKVYNALDKQTLVINKT